MPETAIEVSAPSAACPFFLIAKDPHCLYAGWNLSPEECRRISAAARGNSLCLQVYESRFPAAPLGQFELPVSAAYHFVAVQNADTTYTAQLGYYSLTGDWVSLGASEPVHTPPDAPAADTTMTLAKVSGVKPPEVPPHAAPEAAAPETISPPVLYSPTLSPADQLGAYLAASPPTVEFADAANLLDQFSTADVPADHFLAAAAPDAPTPIAALRLILTASTSTQLSAAAAQPGDHGSSAPPAEPFTPPSPDLMLGAGAGAGASSPFGGEGAKHEAEAFALDVHTDLIIYGTTQPGVQVRIAGMLQAVRPDGSFTCRLSLPEGEHRIPVEAISSNGQSKGYLVVQVTRSIWSPAK